MNQTITAILMCVIAMTAGAQQKVHIMVSYDVKALNWETDTVTGCRMTLLAGPEESKYFNDLSLWSDSMSSTPEGKKELQQIIMAACMTQSPEGSISIDLRKGPVKNVYTYVFCNKNDNSLRLYDKFAGELCYYDEPMDDMQWEICDSTANIIGYECVAARTDYHGRAWTAWFAPELPLPYGPWKFHGLPGLILKAEAESGFEFTATGIEKTDKTMTPMYSHDEYQKVDRKKALAEAEYYNNNKEAIINAKFGGNVQFENNHADRPKYDALRYALEPDYKN